MQATKTGESATTSLTRSPASSKPSVRLSHGAFETIKTKVIPFYQGLLKDSEHEVRSNALTQFENLSRILHLKFNQKDLTYPLLLTIKELLQVPEGNPRTSPTT